MRLLITICARGGSKGIPKKNIMALAGKPLIYYTIDIANRFAKMMNAEVILSTDSSEIKAVASEHGLKTNYTRPEELAHDHAGKIDAIENVLQYSENAKKVRYDYILDMDITSPLRTIEDLETALNVLKERKDALNIFSVSPARRNPYFNMVETGKNGFVGIVKGTKDFKTRQFAPVVYDMNASFYFYRREYFDTSWRIAQTDHSLAYVVPHICFDLDEPVDFKIMEVLINENLLDFNL